MRQWTGRAVTEAREFMATKFPTICAHCHEPVSITRPWVVGHKKSRTAYPELTWDRDNWQIEHKRCSDQSAWQAAHERTARLTEHHVDTADVVRQLLDVALGMIGDDPDLAEVMISYLRDRTTR